MVSPLFSPITHKLTQNSGSNIKDLLEYLEVNRDFLDLEDPNLLQRFWHKVKIGQEKLIKVIKKIKLAAVWLPDQEQIMIHSTLPKQKQEWASFHDTTHTLLKWHRPYFLGDTAQTLDPDFQEQLENEANYGASALMFGGVVFTKDALDTKPDWSSIDLLSKKYKKSLVTTLRRYVQFSHNIPMAMMVSTPWWKEFQKGQEHPWRHFIPSRRFEIEFSHVTPSEIHEQIRSNVRYRSGGQVGDFDFCVIDIKGEGHVFHATSFYNQHDLLTLIVHIRKSKG